MRIRGLAVVAFLFFAGCDMKGDTKKLNEDPHGNLKVLTDTKECSGPAFPGNDFSDNWQAMYGDSEVREVETFTFTPNNRSVTFTKDCYSTEGQTQAWVQAAATFAGNVMQVGQSAADGKVYGSRNCIARVSDGLYSLKLVGNCLELGLNGEATWLVHIR